MSAREGDYILITDTEDERYLQIGEILEVEYFEHCDDIKYYMVRFADKEVIRYGYELVDDYKCKVLMFERR